MTCSPTKRLWRFLLVILLVSWSLIFLIFTSHSYRRLDQAMTLESDSNITEPIIWPQFTTWSEGTWSLPRSTYPNHSFLRSLQTYTVEGHNESALAALNATYSDHPNITAIIVITQKKHIRPQLEAVLAQTLRPTTIWLVCPSRLRSTSLHHSQQLDNEIKVIPVDQPSNSIYKLGSAGQASWLHLVQNVKTDWIWVIDSGTRPEPRHLEYIYRLMQTETYSQALLGTHASLLPANLNNDNQSNILCLPEVFGILPKITQPVDMIHGAWFLRRSWLPALGTDMKSDALGSPIAYYVSQSLLHHAAIPSIVLPPLAIGNRLTLENKCGDIANAFHNNSDWKSVRSARTNPTALDQRQMTVLEPKTVLIFVDGPEQAVAFHPLLCRFRYIVHVVVTGQQRGLSGKTVEDVLNQTNCKDVVIHDLDMTDSDDWVAAPTLATRLAQITQTIQPRVIMQIQGNKAALDGVVKTVAQAHGVVTINLPAEDLQHVLWIADLPPTTLQHWNKINIELVVITDRRPHSLSRLLQSASRSYFLGDSVDMVIHMEQSADLVTRTMVSKFHWRNGRKVLKHRIHKGGLMPAIVESWYPASNDNYAVLLEDDIEVSPLFYAWSKYSILKYRYGDDIDRHMYGVSLYSPRNLELLPAGRRPFDPNSVLQSQYESHTPYLSQVPCSWGAVYFPEHWREFHEYLIGRLENDKLNISVPQSRSNRWKKSWKKYFIELVYLRAYVMLYPNFQRFESFSTNHLEFGTHIKKQRTKSAVDNFLVPLMQRDTILSQLPYQRLPNYSDLPVLDLWGQLKTHQSLQDIAAVWHQRVSNCARTVGNFDPQDLLCPFPFAGEAKESKAKKPSTTKKPKPVTAVQKVEPVRYVTAIGAPPVEPPEFLPKPFDVSKMNVNEVKPRAEEEEYQDLEDDLELLNALI
ncbi:hypothetical protein EC973_008774 [Apophysomyces ossiformis]|uniref:Uncharacterized protein n=1 Tax=Apophysomyces ossiformis TaxID=679940 RepID=A0A8H7BMG2_9FUNG|nr:hypothetical protein EC973_008774 [Apophysomyces ossiformis]